MKKPILLFTAAVTSLALFQAPLQAQAAPNVSVIRVSPGSGCQNSGQISLPSDVNSLLDQLGISGCDNTGSGNAGNGNAGCGNAGSNNVGCDNTGRDSNQSCGNGSDVQNNKQDNTANCPQKNSDCTKQNSYKSYIGTLNGYQLVTPQTCQPETKAPEVQKPDTSKNETKAPETQKPDTSKNDTKAPETQKPDTSKNETKAPETQKSDTTKTGTKAPETQKPDTSKTKTPEVQKPDTSKNDTKTPETPKPDTSKTETKAPEVQKPDTSKTETKAPEVQKTDTAKTDTTANYHAYVLRIVELVNEERAKAGLKPVTLREDVTAVAQVRAQETVTLFSHTRPDGRSCFTALSDAGISYRSAGENIAYGQKSPEEVMNGWMNSSGHRANILNANYTTIGVGYYQSATGVKYWSQMFMS